MTATGHTASSSTVTRTPEPPLWLCLRHPCGGTYATLVASRRNTRTRNSASLNSARLLLQLTDRLADAVLCGVGDLLLYHTQRSKS